jgi:hypothetical protein
LWEICENLARCDPILTGIDFYLSRVFLGIFLYFPVRSGGNMVHFRLLMAEFRQLTG